MIVCQYVHVEQYEARREHISSLALAVGGGGDWFLCSFLLRRIFQGKREKTPRNNSPMSPLFFREFYARIAGVCFSVIVVVIIFMK